MLSSAESMVQGIDNIRYPRISQESTPNREASGGAAIDYLNAHGSKRAARDDRDLLQLIQIIGPLETRGRLRLAMSLESRPPSLQTEWYMTTGESHFPPINGVEIIALPIVNSEPLPALSERAEQILAVLP